MARREPSQAEIAAAQALGVAVADLRQLWSTPQGVYDWADARWGPFDLDACAHESNAKCDFYYTERDDALVQPWRGRVWCNPPWNNIDPFVRRAWEQVREGVCRLACFLVPTRTGQGWWIDVVRPYGQVTLIQGRVPFVPPPGVQDAGGGFEDAAYVVFEPTLRIADLMLGPVNRRRRR